MEKKLGQTSLEFLYAIGIELLLFAVILMLFVQSQEDVAALSSSMEARRICQAMAGQISAISTAGDGASAPFELPPSLYSGAYTAYVAAANRSLTISYGTRLAGCTFTTTSVSNGTSGSFFIANSTVIKNVNGGVVIG
ncbi:Uncharacterised protein [uncultured archaeon]|nr:Uncharacterised protein [uncultured archaeon]